MKGKKTEVHATAKLTHTRSSDGAANPDASLTFHLFLLFLSLAITMFLCGGGFQAFPGGLPAAMGAAWVKYTSGISLMLCFCVFPAASAKNPNHSYRLAVYALLLQPAPF